MRPKHEKPSEEVRRMVFAFGDAGRKAAVRRLADRIEADEDRIRALRSALDSIAYLAPIDGDPHGSLWQAQKRAREALARDDATESNTEEKPCETS